MGTTKDDFQSFGSFPLAIDMLNSLVMAGAMLCDVDFNILADIPSRPFDLETSSEPSSNNTWVVKKKIIAYFSTCSYM